MEEGDVIQGIELIAKEAWISNAICSTTDAVSNSINIGGHLRLHSSIKDMRERLGPTTDEKEGQLRWSYSENGAISGIRANYKESKFRSIYVYKHGLESYGIEKSTSSLLIDMF